MDLEKVAAAAKEYDEQQIANQEAAEREANKTIFDRIGDAVDSVNESVSEVFDFDAARNAFGETYNNGYDMNPTTPRPLGKLEDVAGDVVNAIQTANEKRVEFLHQGANMQEAYQQARETGDYSILEEQAETLRQSGRDASVAMTNVAASPFRQAARNFIASNADDNTSPFQGMAQILQKSDVNLEYFMTSEEKLQKSREIEQELGLPAESTLADNEAYKAALDMYNFKKANDNIENVWEEYPELKEIAGMDKQAAAIALHNIETVRQTHGIIDSFTHFMERGNIKLEYDNLQYKIMRGEADSNDIQRAENLKKMMDDDKKKAPSFLDNPAAAMAAGVAQSLPEMSQGIKEGVKTAAPSIVAATLLTVATGGTGGAALLAGAGAGALRAALVRAVASQGVKTIGTRAFQIGMFKGMAEAETGSRYAELGELKDKDGNPLLSENDRRLWAMAGGAANAGIEMLDFGLITNALKPTPHAARVFEDIIKNQALKKSQTEKAAELLGGRAKDWLKLTAAESGEEALQSAADDVLHNTAVESTGERGSNNKTYSLGEIAGRSAAAFVESIPGSMGFATVGVGGGLVGRAGVMARSAKREAEIARVYGQEAVKTMNGTIMVEQLQQAVNSGKMKDTAPDVQKKVLREQLAGTGYEMAHIDVEMALQKDSGIADLKKVAKAAGMSSEELDTAISEQAYLNIPVEVLAQAENTPDLLDSVTFSEQAESMARMRANQKEITEAYQAALKQTIDNRQQLIDNIINQSMPNATKEQKEMLETAIMMNPNNPAQGYNALRVEVQRELDEVLAPAIKALQDGMGNAGLMEVDDEQGNKKTIRYTENAEWYRNFYKAFKRRPNKQELEDMAIAMLTGDASAPQVQGWTVDSAEMQAALEQNKGNISRLKNHLKTLQEIKSAVEPLTGVEMQLTEGLTPDGFRMYRQIADWLRHVGGATARQARMGAILAARHADIYAAKVTERTGKKYTAADYMRDKLGFSVRRAEAGLNQVEDGKIRFYHGSPNNLEAIEIGKPGPMENVFWGMFFNDESDSARAHAENIYYIDIDEDKIADAKDFAYDENAYNAIKESFGEPLEDEELFHDLIAGIQTIWDVSEDITPEERNKLNKTFGEVLGRRPGTEDYELDWAFQSAAGYIADKLGYEAVWVEDEHGASVIVTPGHTAKKATENEILNQRAWHGSPYDFETFDLGAIGTGEGAQVHGWGLYFAADREIAQSRYRDRLLEQQIEQGGELSERVEIGGVKYEKTNEGWFSDEGDVNETSANLAMEAVLKYTPEDVIPRLKKELSEAETEGDPYYSETLEEELSIDDIKEAIDWLEYEGEYKELKAGSIFEVEIPDNDVLLDEQKPLSQQPEKVKKAIIAYYRTRPDYYGEVDDNFKFPQTAGKYFYRDVIYQLQREGVSQREAPKEASLLLNELGIKGITYEGGQDGRCFVVFDDKAIDVIEKYNQEVRNQQVKGQTSLQANGKRIVSILETADESTFMHEMSHVFLYDLQDLAQIDDVSAKELEVVNEWAEWQKGQAAEYKSTPWAKEFAAREQAIIDAEAAGDYDRADQLKREWRQERFARGFELYLKDGQAPAKGLKAVFRKFKTFLRQIYAAFVSDGGKPTLPVKRVMDRMIASEQEIEAMELDDRYADVQKAGGAKLFEESEQDTYNRWYQEATDEAKEKLLKVVMKDLGKEKQAQFDLDIKKEENRKRRELQQEPVYLAEQAVMASGDDSLALNWYPSVEAFQEELANTQPLEEVLTAYMEQFSKDLDARLIESHLSPEAVEKAMKASKYRVKLESLKGKAMAAKLGLINKINSKAEKAMESIEDKLNAIPEDTDLTVDADSSSVKSVMNEINKLRYAAKWSADDLRHIESMIRANTQEEIREAIKELRESNAKDKIKEEEILKANEGRQAVFRSMAIESMAMKPISDSCNVYYYMQQEKKAARRVRDMIRAKRWDMAIRAQEQQGIFAAMAEIAEDNREKRNKLLSQVNRELTARTVRLPKNERYWHRHLAYILRIAKTDAVPPDSGFVQLDDLLNNMAESLDILEHSLDNVLVMANRGEDFKGYQDLTMDEFKEAVESLHVIYTVGKDKFKMKTIAGKSLLDVVDEITSDEKTIAANVEVDTRKVNADKGGVAYSELIGNTGDIGHLIAKRGQDYIISSLKPENILKMLGNTAHKYIYGTLERAAENEAKMQAENIQALRDIMSAYTHEERQNFDKKIYDLSTEKGEKISKAQIMCMALNWGTMSNRQRLIGGLVSDERTPEAVGKMTEEVLQLFRETMTARDWQVIQKLWDHIGTYWEDTVKVEEQLNGVSLEKIPALPFTIVSSDGQEMKLQGGYMPVKYAPEKSSRAEENESNELAQSMMAGAMRFGAGRSFTKGRTEFDIFRPLQLDFAVVEEHLQNVIHNATYRLPVRDVYRLITNKDFEDYVTNHIGREYHKVLKDWAVDVWKQVSPDTNTADNVLSRGLGMLRRSATMSIMGYRIWPVIENVSNIAVASGRIGSGEMMAALGDFYSDLRGNFNSVKQKSIFMRNRLENLDRDIRSQAGIFHASNKLMEKARDHAYDLMVYSDLMVSAPLWLRSYKNSLQPMIETVKTENEKNIAYLIECQQKVDRIRAEIADLRGEAKAMNDHLQDRRYASPETAEMLRQSPFAMHTDNDLRALSGENIKKAKAMERDLWEAEVAFEEAREIKILSDDEILDEAEQRAIFAADGVVRDTFGSGRTLDLPAVQRSRNEITKLLTTFYGFFNTQFNAVAMAYFNSAHLPSSSAIEKWAPFAKQIMFRFVLTALIGSTLQYGLGLAGNDDDDKKRKVKGADGKEVEVDIPGYERFLKVFGKNSISTATGSMYLVRDVVNAVSDFVINGKTYGMNTGSVAGRGASEIGKMFVLLSKKGQKDAEIQAKEEKKEKEHQEKLAKLKGKKRREYLQKWEEEQKYRKPPKRITYTEIAGHGLKGVSSLTAANTGITSTMVNAVTSTMQYMLDTDMRYDPTWKNVIWSALFDKKPVEREIPKKPPTEPKKKKKGNSKQSER